MIRILRSSISLFRWTVTAPGRAIRGIYQFFTDVPEETPLIETVGSAFGSRDSIMETLESLSEHIVALRGHVFRSLMALVIATGFCLLYTDKLMALLALPLAGAKIFSIDYFTAPLSALHQAIALGTLELNKLQVIEPTESIGVFMRVAMLGGLALAMPWLVFEIYLFIAPGLMPKTRIRLLSVIPVASILFILGLGFTFFIMLPTAMPFLFNFMGFRAAWRPQEYFNLVTNLMFWVGVFFQLPLVVYALAAIGLIKASQVARHWRIAVVVIAIIAAVITPTVDPVNMLLVMVPMILLYFFSIFTAAIASARRANK
jgi:sec-independent protein translocase protein TatC